MATRVQPWAQKYSPRKIKDVLGQDRAVAGLKKFIVNFKQERKKASIIYGPTGCGKTCSVYAIAEEMGLEVVELNASDFRNADGISSIIGNASKQMSLFHKGKIILVDEIDGVSGTKDRGGIPELNRMIKETSFPIVMTANDPFDKKFSSLRKASTLIEFEMLGHSDIMLILEPIAIEEKINYDGDALKAICRRAGGDARAALNDFQMSAANQTLTKEDLSVLSDRERTEEITTALTKVFKTTDPLIAKQSFQVVNEDLKECMLWVDHNLPREYERATDIVRAYDFLSKADIMNRRIMRAQHWRFLAYINDYISAGVAVSKDEKYRKIVVYERSKRPLKIFIANRKYQKRLAICEKIAALTHTSKTQVLRDTYPYIKAMFKLGKDEQMLMKITEDFELDPQEVEYLKN